MKLFAVTEQEAHASTDDCNSRITAIKIAIWVRRGLNRQKCDFILIIFNDLK
ncbi:MULTISPECIES: hypothetical protein [unclassified Pantoea]|uniref:hypothetical protein n=1 Tax=unclassified Pantoea TaxID=2630326 RepID=UPI001CD73F70|nr:MULTISPECIES: hypothetical protein [unclassified Pantoea]MCA1179432.1 hypothetical protein [Pantoea sp. alder69]MCA1253043.1 hypothetical protein [Pantoea sp. alder70]MCA1268217.1 hypothetical protein [Pantoea sp. alder81]